LVEAVTYEDGDIDFDGDVDLYDFRMWKEIYQSQPGAAPVAGVPEPSSVALSLAALVGIAAVVRRRSYRAQ
jgi:hypothetical protein